jgi:ATP-dependent Clp protease ATP-binding subunit ClpA
MFERFTSDARAVVVRAQEEARALRHDYIGTEHLLLGVLAGQDGAGAVLLGRWAITADTVRMDILARVGPGGFDAEALATLGIDLERVRERVEASFGPGALSRRRRCARGDSGSAIPFTPRAKQALELALREALAAGHRHVGDEHIVLGLLHEGDGVAAQILAEHGVRLDAAREIVAGRPAA